MKARSLPIGAEAGRPLDSRAELAGLFAAAASVPRSYVGSLMPRNALDQGIISGIDLVVQYALTALAQGAIDAAAGRSDRSGGGDQATAITAATVDLAALATGLALQALLRRREDERLTRAAARTVGHLLSRGAASGLGASAVSLVSGRLDPSRQRPLLGSVIAAASGVGVSTVLDLLRRSPVDRTTRRSRDPAQVGRSLLSGAAVTTAVGGVAGAERLVAAVIRQLLGRVARPLGLPEGLLGHGVSLVAIACAIAAVLQAVVQRLEQAAATPPPDVPEPPSSRLISAGPGSSVPWATLSEYARRHLDGVLSPAVIERVMKQRAVHPIRVYVGWDSAPTSAERVELALAEIDRTGALDRSLLVLVSPTGTGWVNDVVADSVEYLARGDCALVTLQYSKRPSVLALDRVDEAREQNRALWVAIDQKLFARPPERRPRTVLFGESLGAHASQDVFLHWGTQGLVALGIDRALWIGTPYASKWKQQVLGRARPDVDRSLVRQFARFSELADLPADQRERLRYVLLTHDDDAVAYFGLDLLVRSPDWLEDHRPTAAPAQMQWEPVTTFLQTLIDMKNSANVVPGKFDARGHDYRADLARSVQAAYDLPVTARQLERVEFALRRAEEFRARRQAEATRANLVPGRRRPAG